MSSVVQVAQVIVMIPILILVVGLVAFCVMDLLSNTNKSTRD